MSKLGTIRVVAAFELIKGALILLLSGPGALSLIHHHVQRVAQHLIEHRQLNRARYCLHIRADAAARGAVGRGLRALV
jgi:hypothetical protein